ncbi:unnamed protein product [Phytophthora lilii]|uniref:Unnamed protein product n=1 Tax=Phytophthora lilii TaxID=2077276 RepID=A0A9W7CHK7_9STRA|nr:unnamed protein product [Phytophthora lilii]
MSATQSCNKFMEWMFASLTQQQSRVMPMSEKPATMNRAPLERKLYNYEDYSCPGYYSGGVLAGCIIDTVVFMLLAGAFVWRWQKQKYHQKPIGAANSSSKLTKETGDLHVSAWQDPQLLALQLKPDEIEDVRKIGGGAFADVWLVKYRGAQLLASKRLRNVHETQQHTQNFLKKSKWPQSLTTQTSLSLLAQPGQLSLTYRRYRSTWSEEISVNF